MVNFVSHVCGEFCESREWWVSVSHLLKKLSSSSKSSKRSEKKPSGK